MNAPQGSSAWLAAWLAERAGCFTASTIVDLLAVTRSGPSASRKNAIAKAVAERMTGQPQETYSNAAMQWGTEQEPIARAEYEMRQGVLVDEVGFVRHPKIEWTGASPDGLIGDDGLVEIKCPNTATHIEYLLSQEPPKKYLLQMLWQMECTGRQWCDWVSFDPRMPSKQQLMIVRVHRDDQMIAEMRSAVEAANAEVAEIIKRLEQM